MTQAFPQHATAAACGCILRRSTIAHNLLPEAPRTARAGVPRGLASSQHFPPRHSADSTQHTAHSTQHTAHITCTCPAHPKSSQVSSARGHRCCCHFSRRPCRVGHTAKLQCSTDPHARPAHANRLRLLPQVPDCEDGLES